MPIYEYRCDDCGASFEAFQKMSDDPLVKCEECGGPLRKVLHPVAIHFKGSGFYTTDYGKGSGRKTGGRESSSAGDSSGDNGGSSSDAGSESSKTESGKAEPQGQSKEKQKAT